MTLTNASAVATIPAAPLRLANTTPSLALSLAPSDWVFLLSGYGLGS